MLIVRDIMTTTVYTLDADSSAEEAAWGLTARRSHEPTPMSVVHGVGSAALVSVAPVSSQASGTAGTCRGAVSLEGVL